MIITFYQTTLFAVTLSDPESSFQLPDISSGLISRKLQTWAAVSTIVLLFRVICCHVSCYFGNTLPQTVLISDSLSVFKPRLKTFLFTHAFTEHWSDLPPAPLKLRLYGAIEIWLLLLSLLN